MKLPLRSLLWLFLLLFPICAFPQRTADRGHSIRVIGGGPAPDVTDRLSEEKRKEIEESLQQNTSRLTAEGIIKGAMPQVVAFGWPVRRANFMDFSVDAISNYVDQNPAFPNQVLDWNCGNRTYDDAGGYNHRGVDIFTWPFSWYKMDNSQVEVVAAAPGTIIQKVDGNFDRNCSAVTDNPNMIFLRHDDGTVTWYLHMKQNSLTTKGVGARVEQGEFLGVVGSSGLSTGPHLHFEVHDPSNQLQDPYQGACNNLNSNTYWAAQEPYRNSRINSLLTHSAPPSFPTCPGQEVPNTQAVFAPGSTLYAAAYYRDQLIGQQTQYELQRPDGSVYQTWVHNSPNTYSASYWYFGIPLPASPSGTWKFRATYQGQTYERLFALGSSTSSSVSVTGHVLSAVGRGITNARVTLTNTTTGATRTVATNRKGVYQFTSVPTGPSYTVTAVQRRFDFGIAARTVIPLDNLSGIDIVAHN